MDSSQNRQRMADARQRLDDSRSQIRDSADAMEQGQLSQAQTSATRAQRQLEQMRQELQKQTSSQFTDADARHARPGPAARPAAGRDRPGDRAADRFETEVARGAERRPRAGGQDRPAEREHGEAARRDEERQRPGGIVRAAAVAKALRHAARGEHGKPRPGARDHRRACCGATCCPRPSRSSGGRAKASTSSARGRRGGAKCPRRRSRIAAPGPPAAR